MDTNLKQTAHLHAKMKKYIKFLIKGSTLTLSTLVISSCRKSLVEKIPIVKNVSENIQHKKLFWKYTQRVKCG